MSLFASSINSEPAADGSFNLGAPTTSGFGVPDSSGNSGISVFGGFGGGGNAFISSNAYDSAMWADNASEPFGRVESTKECFARNGEVAITFKWAAAKSPRRPLLQLGFRSNARDTVPLFGHSTQQQRSSSSSSSLFGNPSGNQTSASSGAFTLADTAPSIKSANRVFYDNASLGGSTDQSERTSLFGNASSSAGSSLNPGFGGVRTMFGGSEANTLDPEFGGNRAVFGSSINTTKPPLIPLSTKQVGVSLSNPFAPRSDSMWNTFTFGAPNSTGKSFKAASSKTNPFAAKVSANAVNPFSVRNAPETKKNLFAVPGSVWQTGQKSAGNAGSASMKFKSGLRSAFILDASPWRTGSRQQQQQLLQPVSSSAFDWACWRKQNESTQPSALLKMSGSSSGSVSSPPATSSPPDALVASPDTDPYGSGSFGAGLLEQKIKTAIVNPPGSVELTMLENRPSTALKNSVTRHQPSARFAARLGLARKPLQTLPMQSKQSQFQSRRLHISARTKLPQVGPFRFSSSFSRLVISKTVSSAKDSPRLAEPVHEVTGDSPSPTLLNKEYFTEPSVRELQQLTEEELSRVENFVIGRRGCGKIAFIGATDVRRLHLDNLVTFSEGKVVVYPDDSVKPAIGSGLNKPAIIALHGISAEENESTEDFMKRLESHTQALGATFLGYADSETGNGGVWSFRVENFSNV